MRRVAAFGLVLGLCLPASAQDAEHKVTLTMTTEQAALVLSALEAIQCPSVRQWPICRKAETLHDDMQRQIVGQMK